MNKPVKPATLGSRSRIPVLPSVSPEYFEQEQQKVFRKTWLKAGRVSELSKSGDFVVLDLKALGLSIVIVRNREGELRAFHNVCRHRGNKLAYECKGNVRSFICNFHAWTYDTNGRLIHVPGEEGFENLDKDALALVPVAVDTWMGFIFINLDPQPKETLREYLGQVYDLTEGYPLAQMELSGRYEADIKTNWKTFQDAFMEAYHVPVVHQRSLPDLRRDFIPRDLTNLGKHGNLTAYLNVNHEPFPTERHVWAISNGFMRSADSEGGLPNLPAGMNRNRKNNWAFDEMSIFPNLLVIMGNGWCTVHEFWPISVDETHWELGYFVMPLDNPMSVVANEFFKVRLRDTVREDMLTVESTHTAQKSRAIEELVLSQQEALIAHHRSVLDEYMDA